MAKFGYRDGKLWAKDISVLNAPEFLDIIGNDIVVKINGVRRTISTQS